MDDIVSIERSEGTALVELHRPAKKNALSIALRDAVSDTIDALVADADVKVIVITGAGDVFSAGFDLSEFNDADRSVELWRSSDRFHHTIWRCALPTIAAVNGPALAGGFDLACLCDIRIASTNASFAHPEQAWAPVLYRTIRDLVGGAVARDIVLTGRRLSAEEAHRIGLVTALVEPSQLRAAALEHAALVARAPRDVLLATKAKIIAASGIEPTLRTLEI